MPQVDYDKLASQHGGVDYDAIAASLSGSTSQEAHEATQQAPQPQQPMTMADYAQMAKDALGGVRAGVASTVFGGGDLIRRGLGMERVIDTPEVKALTTAPESTAGQLGKAAEQVGEFFVPGGMAGKAKLAYEALKGGGLTLAHGGTPGEAAVSAVLGGIPAEKVVGGVGKILGRSAERSVQSALLAGGGTQAAKDTAERITPEILKRGVFGGPAREGAAAEALEGIKQTGIWGSRPAMLENAKKVSQEVGKRLGVAYDAAAAVGETVPRDIIRGNIQLARDAMRVPSPKGFGYLTIPGTEGAVNQLDEMDRFLEKLGPDIPVNTAASIRRTWDYIVSKAGLFGAKAQASASDNAKAFALREGANSFRNILNTNPTIEALNAEFSFQKGLANVLTATEKRLQGKGAGLYTGLGGLTGAGLGASTGDSYTERAVNAAVGAATARSVLKALQSPTYRTLVMAPAKKFLADALASGHAGRIASAFRSIAESLPSELREEGQKDGSTWDGLK